MCIQMLLKHPVPMHQHSREAIMLGKGASREAMTLVRQQGWGGQKYQKNGVKSREEIIIWEGGSVSSSSSTIIQSPFLAFSTQVHLKL